MVKYTPSSSFLHVLALYSLVFVAQCATIASNATCYFPDGSVHKLGSPCRPAAGDGACCEATHACLSNGLCFDTQNNHVVRLSCTDSTWTNSACPNYCNTFAPSSIADLRQCNGVNANWVCGQNVSICPDTTGSAKFAVSTGLIDDARSTSLTKIFLQAEPTNTSSAKSGSAATVTVSGVTTTVTTTATVTANSNSTTGSTSSGSGGTEAAVGAGVGVPLLLACIGMAWLYLRERKLRKALVQSQVAIVPAQYPVPKPEYSNYNSTPSVMKGPVYYEPAQELMQSERRAELS